MSSHVYKINKYKEASMPTLHHKKGLIALVLGLAHLTVHAFTLTVSFLDGIPEQADFAYAISTGHCSPSSYTQCHFTQSTVGGIDGEYVMQYIKEVNSLFKTMTPVTDNFHNPTNFVEIRIPGQNGICYVDVLGKEKISVRINKNGTCIK
jgi:hypothetical protein